MGEHVKRFLTGLAVVSFIGCVAIVVAAYWVQVLLTVLAALILFSIYMLGASLRNSKEPPHV